MRAHRYEPDWRVRILPDVTRISTERHFLAINPQLLAMPRKLGLRVDTVGPGASVIDLTIRAHNNADPTMAWAKCDRKLRDRDHLAVKSWKEDIDTLLFLTALISGSLTGFIIEFYKLLSLDPQDETNILLRRLLAQSAGLPFSHSSVCSPTIRHPR